jgi:uncharacterized protein (TIGR03067 family)
MRRLGLVVVAVGLLVGADDPKSAKSIEGAAELQGRWTMASLIIKGDELPESLRGPGSLIVDGVDYRLNVGANSANSTIKLDAAKTPKAIDFAFTTGPQKGETVRGIYKVEGNTLTVCRGLTEGDDRPTTFASPADSSLLLVVWKRAEADPAIRAELAKFEGTWTFASMEYEGREIPAQGLSDGWMKCKGNEYTTKTRQGTTHGTFQVNPTAKPKTIDVTTTDGPLKGTTFLGIYELTADTYHVSMGLPGKPRPSDFTSKAGSGNGVQVMKKEKH